MSTAQCPKCNSKNFSTRMYSLDKETGKKVDITGAKPSSNVLAVLVIIMFAIPAFLGGLWFLFQGVWYYAILTFGIGYPFAKFAIDTMRTNRLMKERTIEHTCNYCKTIWKDDGIILESHEPEIVSPSSAPSEKTQNTEVSQIPTIPEKTEKVDETKLCPRCHMESNTFFICKECGYVNKATGGVLSLIAIVGLAIGVHGLLAWIAGKNTLWVEIVKTFLCGLPGVLLVYWGITEMVYITKSREWAERHNHDMNELINFYKKNPNASFDEAGKFFNHTGQWVQLVLNESESKKE